MLFESGPYLCAAFLCEKVLTESDSVKSAIRIVDRVTRTVAVPEPQQTMEPFNHQLCLFVKFKSGTARGPMTLQVRFVKPSGESATPLHRTVNFEGEDDRGIDVVANMNLKLDMAGLYWFDRYLDSERVTRIPLRVIYLPQVSRTGGSSERPSQG